MPPSRSRTRGKAPATPAASGSRASDGDDFAPGYTVTTVRIRRDQWAALRMAATQRAAVRGGKSDASEILREILDAWLKGQSPAGNDEPGRGR